MKHSFKQSALVLALAAFGGAALAQTPSTPPASSGTPSSPMTSPMTPPSAAPSTTPSPTARMPAKTDTPDAAWRTLDSSNRGYLQSSDLAGTGISFEQADTNKDGRISKEEFEKAWAAKK
jgi:hypothetical protein